MLIDTKKLVSAKHDNFIGSLTFSNSKPAPVVNALMKILNLNIVWERAGPTLKSILPR